MDKQIDDNRDKLERWEALCAELNERLADEALAWLLHYEAVAAPIVSPRTMGQLNKSLRALETELNDETLKKIDEIFPGHNPSSEGYAW